MKIRNDYVSNSSSSSFIVLESSSDTMEIERIKKRYSDYTESYPYVFPNRDYKHEFGWEFENTTNFGGKLNFVGIQLLYIYSMVKDGTDSYYNGSEYANPAEDFEKFYSLVKKVCREQLGLIVELDTSLVKKDSWTDDKGEKHPMWELDWNFNIDHQSAVTEGSCMDMFRSEKDMIDFLTSEKSYVRGGNDNE